MREQAHCRKDIEMRRNGLWIALIALCTMLLAAACQPISSDAPFDDGHAGSATSSYNIEGTTWVLTQYQQDGEQIDVPVADMYVEITFGTDGTFSTAACNNISGTYVADGNMLSITPGPMTMMACIGPMGDFEPLYVNLLSQVASHDVVDGRLVMNDAAGAPILIWESPDSATASEAGAAQALDGTHWILTDYGVENTVSVVPEGVVATASFENGQLSAQVCNVIGAEYTADQRNISFGPAVSTMMFCEETMEIEQAFLNGLENAATYTIDGGFLTILDANGNVLLGFKDDTSVNADPAHEQDGSELAGTSWQVTGYLADGTFSTPDSSFAATLVFGDDGTYSGQVCNGYGGDYTSEGNSVTFGPAVMTMMFCEGPVGEFEPVFHSLLATATSYEMVGHELSLMNDAGEVVLQFAAFAPPTLEGPIWAATGINNGREAVVSLAEGTSATATFAGGTVSGNAGCNTYNAPYTVDGNSLTIGAAAVTMMFCAEPAGLMEQEAMFLTALANTTTYEIHNGILWLRDDNGAIQVTFVP